MTVLDTIGNTPLVRLRAAADDDAEVWVKLEGGNPTGSMKDGMARNMVEGALARGDLQPGGTVVEFTGGSTGSSLALVCAATGLRARLVCSDLIDEIVAVGDDEAAATARRLARQEASSPAPAPAPTSPPTSPPPWTSHAGWALAGGW